MTNQITGMMSEDEFLEHYGVKGMHWGVLRDQAAAGDKHATKKLAKLDRSWEKELNSTTGFVKVNNSMADKMNGPHGELAKLNSRPEFKGKHSLDDPALASKYIAAFEELSHKVFDQAVKDEYGESPSGKYSATYDDNTGNLKVIPADLKHGYLNGIFTFKVAKTNGTLGALEMESLKHDGMMSEDEFLEHYGVKGMHWGKRKSASTNSTHTSADAARVNKIVTRVKKNGLDNLSNDDLAKLNKRNQLVSQYKKDNPTTLKKGHNAVKNALEVRKTTVAVVAAGIAIASNPLVQKGAKHVASVLKNMASNGASGPMNGGTFNQVFKAIGS